MSSLVGKTQCIGARQARTGLPATETERDDTNKAAYIRGWQSTVSPH